MLVLELGCYICTHHVAFAGFRTVLLEQIQTTRALVVSQIKSAATHFISYKVRASRQFIQVQNLKVITTNISYFRQTTAIARDTNYINHAQIRYVSLINRSPSGAFM